MRKQKGFTLIELLIVVAIILIIAAIAIPNLLRARMAANESSAVGSLRTYTTAEIAYNTTFPTIGFSADLAVLGDGGVTPCTPATTSACLLDSVLASTSAVKSGYGFVYSVTSSGTPPTNTDFNIVADPQNRGTTGQKGFYTDSSGVIRSNLNSTAGPTDQPIQ